MSCGGYSLERLIARGAHGAVFEGFHEKLPSRRVAVKVLENEERDDRVIERFIREMEALGKIDHPNVVKVHAAGTADDGRLFIAMELVEGPNLAQALAGGASLERACRWLVEAARGLAALHEKGIVHRDVKPENILIGTDGQARICDLGVARDTARRTQLTGAGDVIGTFEYMAPEQATGAVVGPTADVFGLGAVLYRILAGRPPYQARTALEAVREAAEARPRPPSDLARRIPATLEALCLRAMAANPASRPRDAARFARALEKALAASPSRERFEQARALVRRARPVLILAGLVLALALLASGVERLLPIRGDPSLMLAARASALDQAAKQVELAGRSREKIVPPFEDLERLLAETAAVATAASTRELAAARTHAELVAAGGALARPAGARALGHAAEAVALAPGDAPGVVRAASVALALDEPEAARRWLEPVARREAPGLALALLAARPDATSGSASGVTEAAAPLLAAEALLGAGDAAAALAAVASSSSTGAAALAAEAHVMLGAIAEACLDLRRAEERLASHPDAATLAFLASDEERVFAARGAVLEARGELRAASDALGRAVALAVGHRAGRLALRRAAVLVEAGEPAEAQAALARAERAGLAHEAALVRASIQFGIGDLAGARRNADGAGSARDGVLLRARLSVLIAAVEPSTTGVKERLDAARRELAALSAHGDGAALALLDWVEESLAPAGTERPPRGDEAVAHAGGAEARALRARERLASTTEAGADGAASDLEAARALIGTDRGYASRAATNEARSVAGLALGPHRFPARVHPLLSQEARARLRRAALASLADAPALRLLARIERLEGHASRALGWARLAVRGDALDASGRIEEGLAALALGGDRAPARTALEAAVRLGSPPDAEALVALARVSILDAEESRALGLIRAAIEGVPAEPGLLDAAASSAPGDEAVQELVWTRRSELSAREARAAELDALGDREIAVPAAQRDDTAGLRYRDDACFLAPTPRRLISRAMALARFTRYDEAVLDEAFATVLDGSAALDVIERARGLVGVAGIDGAAREAEEILRPSPREPRRLVARAAIVFAIGAGPVRDQLAPPSDERAAAWRSALASLDAAVEVDPFAPSLRALRGFVRRAAGDAEAGERDLALAEQAGLEAAPRFEFLFARAAAAASDRRGVLAHLDGALDGAATIDVRPDLDLKAGPSGWFGNDPEARQRLESLARKWR